MSRSGPSEDAPVRAFVALPLGAAALGRVAEAIESLRPHVAGVRWVRPEGLHLTLRFLGPSSLHALTALEPALRATAGECPVAVARLASLGLFPERGSPRVLWLSVDVGPRVLALQEACERAAIAAGFAPEDRPFRPHLTLGRWRDRRPRPHLPELDLGETLLDRLVLFKSELGPGGAVHVPLAQFELGRA